MMYSHLRPVFLFFWVYLLLNPLSGQHTFQKAFSADSAGISANDVIATAGGYILAGSSGTNLAGPSDKPFLMKMDAGGNLIWLRFFGPAYQAGFRKVIHANDGGYLAMGDSHGFNSWENGSILLVKTDANGVLQWQKLIPSYFTSRRNTGEWVCPVPGGYIISGRSSKGDSHAVMTRIDNQGNTVWSKRYFFYWGENPWLSSMSVSGDTIFAVGRRDTFAAFNLFDAVSGNPIYHHSFDGPVDYENTFESMAPASNGDWMLAGGVYPPTSHSMQWVCRIGRTGELRWAKSYPKVGYGPISPLSDGNFLLIPHRRESQNANLDPTLVKITADGEVLWSYQYALTTHDVFETAIETPDGGILAVGTVYFPGKAASILVIKTDADGQVTTCCTQPVNTKASPFPVNLTTSDMMQESFDPTWNLNIPTESGSLNSLDYCPPVPGYKEVYLCPGDSLVIDGTAYTSPGFVYSTAPGPKCDTNLVYNIRTGLNPRLEKTVYFCPGDSVTLQGITYTQPGTYTQVVPSATGQCYTLATYMVQYTTPNVPTAVSLNCPADMSVQVPYGTLATPLVYAMPAAWSDCPCPGIQLLQMQGGPSGSPFTVGDHSVCFQARDSCDNQSDCCFQINIAADDALPCDEKTNGCINFELLRITLDAQGCRTHHIRIQNNCSQPFVYTAFQLPKGVIAYSPQGNSSYLSPSGHPYTIRNPNYSPIYSIRFEAQGAGLRDGESDVFSYTLPPLSAPDYINCVVKLRGHALAEAHLNTFNCPPEKNASAPDQVENRNTGNEASRESLLIYPNPAEKEVVIVLKDWMEQPVQIRLFNAQGHWLSTQETDTDRLSLQLDLPAGIYFVEATALNGPRRQVSRFMVR